MILLIQYDRKRGRIVQSQAFEGSQRREAEDARLRIELELIRKKIGQEAVLLEAASEDAIRPTHRRYFEDLRQVLESGIRHVKQDPDSTA